MNFQPTLFIGIGRDGHYFTLRETYLHHIPGPGPMGNVVLNGVYQGETEVRSFHHCNLSQDAEEALEKAKQYAEQSGTPLNASETTLKEEMAKIQRASAEELERRAREVEEREARWAKERADKDSFMIELIDAGFWPFKLNFTISEVEDVGGIEGIKGARECLAQLNDNDLSVADPKVIRLIQVYTDSSFRWLEEISAMNRGTLTWWAKQMEPTGEVAKHLQATLLSKYVDFLLPEPDSQKHIGTVGERRDFEATVIRSYSFEGFYGRTYFTTMVTEEGVCLLCKSASFSPAVGKDLKFKATIKEHGEYRGQAQTVVQRIKLA